MHTNIRVKKLDGKNRVHQKLVQNDIYKLLHHNLGQFYPKYTTWYKEKIIKGFKQGNRIILVIRDADIVQGVSILKTPNSKWNNKICCFYISHEHRDRGLGKLLMHNSLQVYHSSKKPIIMTVPEEKLVDPADSKSYLDFLRKYNFDITEKIIGKYRPGKIEFVLMRVSTG